MKAGVDGELIAVCLIHKCGVEIVGVARDTVFRAKEACAVELRTVGFRAVKYSRVKNVVM